MGNVTKSEFKKQNNGEFVKDAIKVVTRLAAAKAASGNMAGQSGRAFQKLTSSTWFINRSHPSHNPNHHQNIPNSTIAMADKAGINRSLSTIRTELEYLRDSGVVNPPQFQSIMAQLPVNTPNPSPPTAQSLTMSQQQAGVPSQYVDPHYAQGGNYANPTPVAAIAQASQDPNHPANPNHPKVWPRCIADFAD